MKGVDTDYVLTRTRHRGRRGVVHLPGDGDNEPACGIQLRLEDAEYSRIPTDRAPDNARLCKYCDPDHTIEKSVPETSLASLLENASPDITHRSDSPQGGGL